LRQPHNRSRRRSMTRTSRSTAVQAHMRQEEQARRMSQAGSTEHTRK
jgi:hypothetical protein